MIDADAANEPDQRPPHSNIIQQTKTCAINMGRHYFSPPHGGGGHYVSRWGSAASGGLAAGLRRVSYLADAVGGGFDRRQQMLLAVGLPFSTREYYCFLWVPDYNRLANHMRRPNATP